MVYAIIIVTLLLIYIFVTYNSLIKLNNIVKEAFSTMDIYLKKRWDLIPNLVEVVKEYAKTEKDILNQLTELKTNTYKEMSMNKKITVNEQLTNEVSKIVAVSENYPELKANQNFLELSRELSKIEDEIANSRKYYNGSVRVFNTRIQVFPNTVIANIFGFKTANMFDISSNEKNNLKVEL